MAELALTELLEIRLPMFGVEIRHSQSFDSYSSVQYFCFSVRASSGLFRPFENSNIIKKEKK